MFHKIAQPKVRCTSIMIDMPAREYLALVDDVYRTKQGGIVGQRAALKTKTAKTIRDRMVVDILKGVSLPPLVVGVLVDSVAYKAALLDVESREDFKKFLDELGDAELSIIDGMQRTTAIHEAIEGDVDAGVSDVRVEFWISEGANSLIYRMLVLNTGQVPWDIARQLEAVYRPLLKQVEGAVEGAVSFLSRDDGRRSNLSVNIYETEDVVELLLIFSSRKRELNLKDQIAQDFVRLDMIESSSHVDLIRYFSEALILLSELNFAMATYEAGPSHVGSLTRYVAGKEVFRGFPAKAGFIAALSIFLFDKPGFDTDWDAVESKFEVVKANVNKLIDKIKEAQTPEEKELILKLEDLEERIAKHRVGASQVGRFEREFFEKAFSVLFEDSDRIKNFQACWLAY
ncbi:hypothetical protein [Pseudomonas sp. WS 5414]|uniref:hypothetical protein n=1 Tax=Pseudomonas TaxID=286 RepID=UPI001472C14A|nr:hypothetical protein [Pseudomonas sp. WS 5414]NMY71754.1 hypothetical protein [Pseudomonas sp. WS 5414]